MTRRKDCPVKFKMCVGYDSKLAHKVGLDGEIGDLKEDHNVIFSWSII